MLTPVLWRAKEKGQRELSVRMALLMGSCPPPFDTASPAPSLLVQPVSTLDFGPLSRLQCTDPEGVAVSPGIGPCSSRWSSKRGPRPGHPEFSWGCWAHLSRRAWGLLCLGGLDHKEASRAHSAAEAGAPLGSTRGRASSSCTPANAPCCVFAGSYRPSRGAP